MLARCAASIRPGAAHPCPATCPAHEVPGHCQPPTPSANPGRGHAQPMEAHKTVTTVDVTTTRPRRTGDRDRLCDRRGVRAPRARGIAFALPGLCSTTDIVLLAAGATVFAIDHAAPNRARLAGAVPRGNSVAELGRKAEVGDVAGERHPVRVPPRHPDGRGRRGNAYALGFSVAHARRTAQPNSSACNATEQGCL